MDKILEVKNLSVQFKSYAGLVHAVRGVSFNLYKGQTLAIVGESGCGKSVTSKAIMGLLNKESALIGDNSEINYMGENILKYNDKQWADYRGEECSIIFQDALAALNPTLKIGKQIAEKIILKENKSKEEAYKESEILLKKVGITDSKKRLEQYPHELSGGMRQRVMIAIALACNPKIMIADEPTTALDVTIQAQILELINQIQKESSMGVILITHDLGIVADIADYVQVMYSGLIMESGTLEDIYYNSRHPYTLGLLNSVPRLDLDNQKKLYSIPGTPPSLISKLPGCPFASRCEYCMNICEKERPPIYKFSDTHFSSCWLQDKKNYNRDIPIKLGGGKIVKR